MEWPTLVHRLRVQAPRLKVLRQEQAVPRFEQTVLVQEPPTRAEAVLFSYGTETDVVFVYRGSVPFNAVVSGYCTATAVVSGRKRAVQTP